MRRLLLLSAIVLIQILISFSAIYAQGSYVCDYCKKGTSYANFYCEHCGTWTPHPDSPIKHEVELGIDCNSYNIDGNPVGSMPHELPFIKTNHDRLSCFVSTTYYLNTKYQNPVVPFSFSPYNYRESKVMFIYNHLKSENERETDFPATYKGKANISLYGGEVLYYLNRFFVGGQFYNSESDKYYLYTDKYPFNNTQICGEIGLYTPNIKYGIKAGLYKENYKEDHPEDNNYLLINPYVEYLPTTNTMIFAGFKGRYTSIKDVIEYQIPLLFKIISYKSWWQAELFFEMDKLEELNFEGMGYYFVEESRYTGSVKLEKLSRNSSFYINPQIIYMKTVNDHFAFDEEKITSFVVELGGTKSVFKRKGLLEASLYYGMGNNKIDSNPKGDISQFGGSLSLKAFF